MGLFLLDAAVVIRYLGITPHTSGYNLTLDLFRLFRKTGQGPAESISNIAVFIPFGFFLAESLVSLNRTGTGSWRRVGWVLLAAFGMSLCIECLQLVLKVGFFEVTDLGCNKQTFFVLFFVKVFVHFPVGSAAHLLWFILEFVWLWKQPFVGKPPIKYVC